MAKVGEKLTPAMKQYHHFKEKYPDAVLFFRMGDFYETFYEDAQTCSRVLGLTLTSRSKGPNPVPLAGLPYHAIDNYMKKMLQAGYKVAVCEQVEDARDAKGVVKRDVVRIVTPGTLTDEMLLDSRQDNYLAAVSLGTKACAIAWVDISTGHFFVQQVNEKYIIDELLRLGPRECLLAERGGELFSAEAQKLAKEIGTLTGAVITERPGWYFDPHTAGTKLMRHFGVATLEGFGIEDGFEGVCAAGAILEYLNETQKTALNHIRTIKKINRTQLLQIDQTTLRSLEVLRTMRTENTRGTLLDSIDHTLTGMGARMIRSWLCMPLCDVDAIELRQDATGEFVSDDRLCREVRGLLADIADIERIVARISTFRTSPRDLVSLRATLGRVPPLRETLGQCRSDLLMGLSQKCDSMDELAELLESAIEPECPTHMRDGGVIRSGFDAELDRLRGIGTDGRSWLAEYQRKEINRTGIANLKIGFNKVFGYYIEMPRSLAEKAPAEYIRKQTVKNAERYITEELKEYEQQALGAQDRALELENKLFEQVRAETTKYIARLQSLADCIANTDCLCSLGFLSRQRGYIRPTVTNGRELIIEEGRHPVLAQAMGAEFVPNDVCLGSGGRNSCQSSDGNSDEGLRGEGIESSDRSSDVIIITGPNMAGKSTYIRQVALLVLLAQSGSFIPAKSARIGIVDRIFTRVGAADELLRGQSTFMVEMTETANIINNATDRSLVILDEVGRGTSTYDGLSLAWAITEHIANQIKCRTLFATHYHQLTELAQLLINVRNCNVAVREWAGSVVFLHKILPGGTDKSYGIHVARLAGLPNQITQRSAEILADLESTFTKEAGSEHLARMKTSQDPDSLFVQRHKSVLEKLASVDVNNLTPIEAIGLLNQIKNEINQD